MICLSDSEERSFWAKVAVGNPTDCWTWLRSTNGVGYGKLKLQGKYWLAHRLAYMLKVGDPGNMLLCHTCDNRACVNPNHLFLGKHKDNTQDCIEKGRFAKGTEAGGCILTEEDVIHIRNLYVPRKFGRYKIARQLGLSAKAVGGVVNGNNWSWLKESR